MKRKQTFVRLLWNFWGKFDDSVVDSTNDQRESRMKRRGLGNKKLKLKFVRS